MKDNGKRLNNMPNLIFLLRNFTNLTLNNKLQTLLTTFLILNLQSYSKVEKILYWVKNHLYVIYKVAEKDVVALEIY